MLGAGSRGVVDVGAALAAVREPAGLFELLHDGEYGGVGRRFGPSDLAADLFHGRLAQLPDCFHDGGLQIDQVLVFEIVGQRDRKPFIFPARTVAGAVLTSSNLLGWEKNDDLQ